jgi:hypothetical protein
VTTAYIASLRHGTAQRDFVCLFAGLKLNRRMSLLGSSTDVVAPPLAGTGPPPFDVTMSSAPDDVDKSEIATA